MKINVVGKVSGLNGGQEVWVRVYSNDVHDWPSVEDMLDDGQRAMLENLGRRTLSYFPHSPNAEEREDHGYTVEDHWVWAATKKNGRR